MVPVQRGARLLPRAAGHVLAAARTHAHRAKGAAPIARKGQWDAAAVGPACTLRQACAYSTTCGTDCSRRIMCGRSTDVRPFLHHLQPLYLSPVVLFSSSKRFPGNTTCPPQRTAHPPLPQQLPHLPPRPLLSVRFLACCVYFFPLFTAPTHWPSEHRQSAIRASPHHRPPIASVCCVAYSQFCPCLSFLSTCRHQRQ